MNNKRRLLFLAAGSCVSVAAWAVGPQASTRFFVEDQETHQRTFVSTARLDQYVCIQIGATLTTDGDHAFTMTIYDGRGREVDYWRSAITAEQGSWKRNVCFGYNEERDAPGTWWYVGEIDGEPLFSESIEIRPAVP
jgi:hypothetical protein